MEVTVKDSVTVRPARPTPRRTLPCSVVDLVMTRTYVPTVYFYRPPPDGSDLAPAGRSFFDAAKLKAALAQVLVPFYPVAGRITMDGNGRPAIACNEEGVVFMEAESNAVLEVFGEFGPEHGPEFVKLVPPVPVLGSDYGSPDPLFQVQVTHFRCGGASLGVIIDHFLADGFASLNLINRWAEVVRGGDPLAAVPLLDRGVLCPRDPPTPQFSHPEWVSAPPCLALEEPFVSSIFRLTPGEIDRLKSRCVVTTGHGVGERCGTYETLVAHTWRCVCIARGLPPEQKTRVYMPVSILRKLQPPMPASYLGNAILRSVCDATVGEVAAVPTHETISKVRRAIARMDDTYVRSTLDYFAMQPDPSKLRTGKHVYGSPNLSVNSWVQLPIYDADFGWGKPVFMGPTRVHSEGVAYIFPRPFNAGGLTVVIGLHLPAMERFKTIFYDF